MSLININNSKAITGVVRSVQLYSASHGSVFWRTEDNVSIERVATQAIHLSHYEATVFDARGVENTALTFLNGLGGSLYSIMALLNSEVWKVTRIECDVDFVIDDSNVNLNLKTTWQENPL